MYSPVFWCLCVLLIRIIIHTTCLLLKQRANASWDPTRHKKEHAQVKDERNLQAPPPPKQNNKNKWQAVVTRG